MIKYPKKIKVLAVIPARGGSKGIPYKNLKKIAGLTLVEHAVRVALNCPLVYKTILSTDDPKIAKAGKRAGAEIPFLRPRRLAGDKSRTIDAVLHLLKNIKDEPEIILLLQPTAPVRSSKQASEALNLLINDEDADAVVSVVSLNEPHPLKTKTIEDGRLKPYFPGADSQVPRQLLSKAYKLNGAIYAVKRNALLKEKSFLPKETIPYVMPAETGINIDSPFDLIILKSLVKVKSPNIIKYLKH